MRVIAFLLVVFFSRLHAMPISGSEIFSNPDVSKVSLSPDGKWVSSYLYKHNKYYLSLTSLKTGKEYSLLNFNNGAHLKRYRWVDQNNILIDFSQKDKVEDAKRLHNSGVLSLEYKEGIPQASFKRIPGKFMLVGLVDQEPGKLLVAKNMKSTRLDWRLYKIHIQGLVKGDFSAAMELDNYLDDALIYYSEDGESLFAHVLDDDEIELWHLANQQGEWRKVLSGINRDYQIAPVGFLANGKLAVLSDRGDDLVSLYTYDTEKQRFGEVLYQHKRYDLKAARLSPEGELVSVSYMQHGELTTEYFNAQSRQLIDGLKSQFKGKQLTVLDQADQQPDVLLVGVYSLVEPIYYYVFDRSKNTLTPYNSSYPDLGHYTKADTQYLSITTVDDIRIDAYLTTPPSDQKNGVLLVMPHGGPIGVADHNYFNREVTYLSSRGYSILRVNFRGSAGFGREFMQRGVGEFGKAIEQDISAALTETLKKHSFDSICAMGASYGGYSAFMLAVKHPETYQCVVAQYGIYDLPLAFSASNLHLIEENKQRVENVIGELKQEHKENSPIRLIDQLHAPILVVAGKDDRVADFEHSSRLKYLLEHKGKTAEFLFYKNVGHGHSQWNGDHHELAYVDDYLRRTLKLPKIDKQKYATRVAESFVRLADGYEFDNILEPDTQKAFEYFKAAAELGEARAMFNLGSFYHRGRVVEQDLGQAASWYKKASDAGYAGASYRLGRMFYQGEHSERDFTLSTQYYDRAVKQGYDAESRAYLARAYCLGLGVKKETNQCVQLLRFGGLSAGKTKLTKESLKIRGEVLTDLMLSSTLSKEDISHLQAMVREEFNVGIPEQHAQVSASGLYRAVYHFRGWRIVHHDDDETASQGDLSERKRYYWGADFGLAESMGLEDTDRVAYFVKWRKYSPATNKTEILEQSIFYGPAKDGFRTLKAVNLEEAPGTRWDLYIFDLQQREVFNRSFYLNE